MVPEVILSLCAWFGFAPGTGALSHELEFRTQLPTRDRVQVQMPQTQYRYCSPHLYQPTLVFVTSRDARGDYGPRSGTLLVEWRWNFDGDGDGVVGRPDFGGFVGSFGSTAPRDLLLWDSDGDGKVGMGDWSQFLAAYGTCNGPLKDGGLREVPCS